MTFSCILNLFSTFPQIKGMCCCPGQKGKQTEFKILTSRSPADRIYYED